jgi:hypothetical protein
MDVIAITQPRACNHSVTRIASQNIAAVSTLVDAMGEVSNDSPWKKSGDHPG